VVLDHVHLGDGEARGGGWGGTVLTSPDGVTWTSRASGPPQTSSASPGQASQLVAVGSAGTILTSPCSAPAYPYSVWVPVASHNSGKNNSQWRSDLGLLNAGSVTANAQITLFLGDVLASNTTYVPAGTQSILTDVVGQLGASGSGALNILSDQPFKVTSRSYNEVSPAELLRRRHAGAGLPGGGHRRRTGCGSERVPSRDWPRVLRTGATSGGQHGHGNCDGAGGTVRRVGDEADDYTVSLARGALGAGDAAVQSKALQRRWTAGTPRITAQTGSGSRVCLGYRQHHQRPRSHAAVADLTSHRGPKMGRGTPGPRKWRWRRL